MTETTSSPGQGLSIIPPDLGAYISAPASIVVSGNSCTGKSGSVAEIASGCLWVVTKRNALRAYASMILAAQQEVEEARSQNREPSSVAVQRSAWKLPKKVVEIPEFVQGAKGEEVRFQNGPALKQIIGTYLKGLREDPNAFTGIVFDEWSRFAQRLQEEYQRESNNDVWEANRKLHATHRYLAKALPEASKKSLVLICEWREPEFYKNGEIKALGGPSLPTVNMTKPLTYEMDFVFQVLVREVRDNTKDSSDGRPVTRIERVFSTEVHPFYSRKSRDARIPPVSTDGLDKLLSKAEVFLG